MSKDYSMQKAWDLAAGKSLDEIKALAQQYHRKYICYDDPEDGLMAAQLTCVYRAILAEKKEELAAA